MNGNENRNKNKAPKSLTLHRIRQLRSSCLWFLTRRPLLCWFSLAANISSCTLGGWLNIWSSWSGPQMVWHFQHHSEPHLQVMWLQPSFFSVLHFQFGQNFTFFSRTHSSSLTSCSNLQSSWCQVSRHRWQNSWPCEHLMLASELVRSMATHSLQLGNGHHFFSSSTFTSIFFRNCLYFSMITASSKMVLRSTSENSELHWWDRQLNLTTFPSLILTSNMLRVQTIQYLWPHSRANPSSFR